MCVQTLFGLLITLSLYRPRIVFKRLLDQKRNCVDLCHESMLGVVCLVFVLGIRCVQLVPMSSEPPCHHWRAYHSISAHSCFCKRCLWLRPVQPVHVQLQPVHVWLLRRAIKPSKRLRSLGLQCELVSTKVVAHTEVVCERLLVALLVGLHWRHLLEAAAGCAEHLE